MKVLLDMNLSPTWVGFLQKSGFEAVHWSTVGDARAKDSDIMSWARDQGYVVFTHDLDYSALLAATRATGPSVLQIRSQDVMPENVGAHVVDVLTTYASEIDRGAIVSIDEASARIRILPLLGRDP